MPSSIDSLGRDTRRVAGDARDMGRDAGRLGDRVRDTAPELVRQARDVFDDRIGQLRDQGREAASAAGDQLEDARAFMVDRVQERPLTATFAALGVGFLLGLLISGSKR